VHDPEPRIAADGEGRDSRLGLGDGVEIVKNRVGRIRGLPGISSYERGAASEGAPVFGNPCGVAPGKLDADVCPGSPISKRRLALDRTEALDRLDAVDSPEGLLRDRFRSCAIRETVEERPLSSKLLAYEFPCDREPLAVLDGLRLGPSQACVLKPGRAGGGENPAIGIDLHESGPHIGEPAEGIEADRARMPEHD
jgi:hypothetical protein